MGQYAVEVPVTNRQTFTDTILGPGFTSTSPLSIIKQLHSHTSTPRRILNNRKIEIYNFVVIFET